MNSSLINLKSLGVLFTAASALFLGALPSNAVIASFDPIDFNDVSSGGGTIDKNASSTGNINIGGTPNGFGGHFSSGYLLLGATDADLDIPSSVTSGDSVALSNSTFRIFSNTNNVTLRFNYAFYGNNNSSSDDEFSIGIVGASGFQSFFDVQSPNFSSGAEFRTLSGFAPGDYRVGIQLNEAGGFSPLNSAAGFNNITVAVPFEFSPAQGLLAIGSMFALSTYLKRKKAAQSSMDLT